MLYDPYLRGQIDYLQGYSLADNPFDEDSWAYDDWEVGWRAAWNQDRISNVGRQS